MKRTIILFTLLGIITEIIAQVIDNPVFDRCDVPAFRVQKVEIALDTTYVYCLYSAEAGSWANISRNTYLKSYQNSKKYSLINCVGLPYSPHQKSFTNDEICSVLLCFPPIKGITKFDIIENENDKAFNIYGIDLLNQYDVIYKESDVSRFSNMASFYDSAGDTIKALLNKSKEIDATKFVYGIKSEPLIISLQNASIMYDKYGYYGKAVELAKQEGEIHAEVWGTSDWSYALYLRGMGEIYSKAKKHTLAIQKYEESIKLFESIPIIDNEYALALSFAASEYFEIGDAMNGLLSMKKCMDARRQMGDSERYIDDLRFLLLIGHDDGMIQRIQLVLDELSNLPSFIEKTYLPIAGIYKEIAIMYSLLDDNENAIEYCNKAISVLESNNSSRTADYAELLALKCKCQQRSGLKDEAIVSGETAKQKYESLNNRSGKYAELLGDLAWAYGLDFNFEKSIQLRTISAEIYENSKDWLSLAEAYNSISHYYHSGEDLDSAELYIKKAIGVLNEHDNAEQFLLDRVELTGNSWSYNRHALASIKQRIGIDKSNFYQTLARIYQKRGNYTDAIKTELANGILLKNLGENRLYAVHLMTLSEYYLKNNQQGDAIACSDLCNQLLYNEKKVSLALPRLQLANVYFQAGDTLKAMQNTKEAISLSTASNEVELKITAQYILSYLYWKNKNYVEGEKCLSETLDYLKEFVNNKVGGLTTEQKQRIWDKYEQNFLLYREIIVESDRNGEYLSKLLDYELFSKSLLLDANIQNNINNSYRINITWRDIQQYLSDEDIAIEFISSISDTEAYFVYHALIIDKNSQTPLMITLYRENDLDLMRRVDNRHIGDIVGELIWKPVLKQYPNVKNIYFSPDGIFHRLPIEYYNVDQINMFENYNMYRLSSTKELVMEYSSLPHQTAVLYGGLDYNQLKQQAKGENSKWRGVANRGGFDPIDNTLGEVEEVNNLLIKNNISTTVFSGENGTEETFRNLTGQNISMIHLATHGMYISPDSIEVKKQMNNFEFLEFLINKNDPVKEDITLTHSFLVMSGGNRLIRRETIPEEECDGILTAKEISQLNLKGLDLVVLSACESGLGDINTNGIFGLQRGFKKAGANTILMSLDKVDDDATRLLMVEFYKNLMDGKTKRQSLKDAQKHLRHINNGKYDNPKYWASFIMLDGLN